MAQIKQFYRLLISAGNSLQSPFLLIIRLAWGYQMRMTGMGKLHSLDRVTGFFTQLGIPFPAANAIFIAVLEFVGGLLFALGLGSRLVALLFAGDMLVAYIAADREALTSIFTDPNKFYAAAPYTFLVAALIVFIFGPGKFSIDSLLSKRFGASDSAKRPA